MQKLQDILTSADVPGRNEQPSTSTSWCLRQSAAQDELQKEAAITSTVCCPATVFQRGTAATAHLLPLFAAETACRRSGSVWIVTYIYTPNSHYHNRESCIEGVYKPIEPTLCCAKEDGRYTLVKQGSCLNFFVMWLKLCLFFYLFFFAPCKCGGWKVRLAENGSHTSISLSQGSCGYRCSLPPRCECA